MAIPAFALSTGFNTTFLRPHNASQTTTTTVLGRKTIQTPSLPRFYAAHATFTRPRGAVSQPQPRRDSYTPQDREPFKAVPGAKYYTECGHCTAIYEIDPDDLGSSGKRVQCTVCDNTWFQRPDRLRIVPEGKEFIDYPISEKDERIKKRKEQRFGNRSVRGTGTGAGAGRQRRRGSNYAVFVGNLPYDSSEDELGQLVSGTAEVLNVSIVKDKETGRSKGFGFVNVPSEADVQNVVKSLDGIFFHGRSLTMRAGNRK